MNVIVHWWPMMPAIVPALGALLVLLVDAVVPRRRTLPWVVALGTLVVALVSTGPNLVRDSEKFGSSMCFPDERCLYMVSDIGAGLQAGVLGAAFVVALLAAPVRTRRTLSAVQVAAVLTTCAGACAVIAARGLPSWIVGLELATLPTIALAAFHARRRSVEAALNLLVTALLSFAFLAMGAAMWFAASGDVQFSSAQILVAGADSGQRRVLAVGVMLLVVGVGFKLALAPFHAWTPQVYAGASVPMTAFFATVSKLAALGALLAIARATATAGGVGFLFIAGLSVVSMTLGNLMALRERNTLRFLGWSSVAQGGWMVMPLAVSSPVAWHAAAAYALVYVVGTLGIFAVLTDVAHRLGRHAVTGIDDLRGLGRRRPVHGLVAALGLLLLAGLPPAIGGVVAKVFVFEPLVAEGRWSFVVLAALNAVLGVAVYLRWVWALFAAAPATVDHDGERSHPLHLAVVLVGGVALLAVSINPQFLLGLVD